MKLISFGEVLWDIYPDGKCIGGAPFNFAAHAARLGEEAYLLSAVGKDALGEETLAAVRAAGARAAEKFGTPGKVTASASAGRHARRGALRC